MLGDAEGALDPNALAWEAHHPARSPVRMRAAYGT